MEKVSVVQVGTDWAVKHHESILGSLKTPEDAAFVGRDLVRWLESQGRPAELLLPATDTRALA